MPALAALCAAFLLIATGAFLVYRRAVRGRAQEVILMDGALCAVVSSREVVIRPRTIFSVLVMALLGLFLAGAVAVLVTQALSGDLRRNLDAASLVGLAFAVLIPLGAIPFIARSLGRPRLHFDGQNELLRIGGRQPQQIPFARMVQVVLSGPPPGPGSRVLALSLRLKEGRLLPLGTVSGQSDALEERAQRILEVVAQVTKALPSDERGR